MKQIIIILLLQLFFLSSFLYSDKIDGEDYSNYDEVKCLLKVKKNSFKPGERIEVDVILKNNNSSNITLTLSDNWYYNIDFLIKTIQNREIISEKKVLFDERVDNQEKSEDRSFILRPSQIYGKTINLTDYYQLDKPGHYIIQAYFNFVPTNNRIGPQKKSNIIQIEIQEASSYDSDKDPETGIEDDSDDKLRNPYDTIDYMLQARKEEKWRNYFKYINLEKLIVQNSTYYKRYLALPQSKRESVLEDYKEFIKRGPKSEEGFKFESFSIYKSVIQNERKRAKIYVIMTFKGKEVSFKRKYIYSLSQIQGKWKVYAYQVENI